MQLRSSGLFLHRDQWIIDTLSKAMSAALVRKSSREMTPPKSAAKMTAKSMPQKSIEIPLFSSVEQWMTVCPRKPLSSKTILAPVMICKLFYSTNQIRTTMSRILLASYPGSPSTCTPITTIESIKCSLRFSESGRFKSSSIPKQIALVPAIFLPVSSPARGPEPAAPAGIFLFRLKPLTTSSFRC